MRLGRTKTVCEWQNVQPQKPNPDSVVGLAISSLQNGILHGLRHPSKLNSNGWFIWCGEYSKDKDFFSPVCVKDLTNYLDSDILEYLDLPSGYRFLIDGTNYEDVWYDKKLLKT
ncbi:immunity protein Imm33 domain-containing protein [Flagellimonas sp.]|uniref:immunity protein Imm33 domain-containing protein n=1 Tax=Flagellimonas sp. TaxID=2058762 RepID=UPI003B527313